MLYSKYKVKVARQMKILSALIKYKWLIMGIATFCIVFTSIFLGVQGVITDDGSGMLVTEVTYGESVEYDAKALLSGVAYQYRKIGDTEWTDAKPDKVGEYEVRAVTTRSFGQKNYGKAFRFTINPQKTEVTLASATGVYGDKPSITADLAYSDKIVDFDFRYAEIADRKTTLSIDPASFVVQNAAGEDVSSQYEFSFADTEYALQQRKITFASGSEQFIYAETEYSFEKYEIPSGSLAFDDVATVSFDKTISSVGKEANSFEVTVKTAAGDDVTDLYAVTKNYGELRVIGKNIIITGKTDAEIIYDGKEHTDDGYTLDGNTPIVDGHEIRVKETTFATEAGEHTNEMTFEIVDAEGNDVTDCYDLDVTPGKFTIKPRPINVTTADQEFTYDGTAQFYEGCEADDLVEGHVLSVTSHTEITNVTKGKVANKLTVKVMNGETDVTANYYLPDENYTYGALTMLPRKITVTANGDTFTYDGAAHSSTEFTVAAEPDGLVDGHEAAVIADTVKTITTVGKTDNDFKIAITANGEPVTDNYEITYELGTLEVTKRKVKITTPTEEFIYDGAAHSSTAHANFVIGEGEDYYPLVGGHTIAPADISAVPTITNVFDGENGVANEFAIKIVDADGNDVTENYDTEDISFGTLKVTPRFVTVKADDDQKTYNGEPLVNDGCKPSAPTDDSGLVDGHELIAKAEGTITNAGTADNVVNEPAQILAANGDDVTRNYDIEYAKGTLTVTPRDIIVTTDDGIFTYDGDEHYQPSCSADALVDKLGHKLVATNCTTITNVGESGKENSLEVKVVDADGNDAVDGYYLSDNYNIIEWKNGTLTVLARTVRVTTGSDSKVYDGMPLTKHMFETQKGVENEGLVEKHSHTMTLEFTGTITNVKFNEDGSIGAVENTVDRELTQIFDGSGEPVIANYKIEYTLGTLEINRRKIKITTPTEEFIYDGEPHSSVTNFDISVPEGYYDLVYGHTIAPADVSAVPTITNVLDGVVRNAFAVQIYDGSGEPVTGNYAVELSDGELTVAPRIVRVNVLGDNKVYDGTPLTGNSVDIEEGVANEGLLVDHYISFVFTGSQTDAGQSVNTIDEEKTKVLTLVGNEPVTSNYDIKYNYDKALLVVKQRPITITANSDDKEYDGDPLTSDYKVSEYTAKSGLVLGQILTVEVEGSQTVKGSSANVIKSVKITVKDENGNEKDVTANYDITSINGVLTVNPRAIKVKTRPDEFTYDGLDHAYNNDGDYEIVEGSLVKDHRFELSEYTTVKDANGDGVKNEITLKVVRGEADATEDMSENYAITYDCGMLKVNRRPIDITTASAIFEYDGTAHTTEYSENEITQDNLVTGHRIQVDSRTEITYVQQSGTLNKLVVSIWNGTENVTDNYDIHYDEGTLTVTPKAITVTSESHEFTYNGTDQFWWVASTDGLVSDDQYLKVIAGVAIQNVNESGKENVFVVIIVTADGKDNVDGYKLTNNYTITCVYGKLTVIPRPITITANSAEKEYDGTPLTNSGCKYEEFTEGRGLVEGHNPIAQAEGSVTNVNIVYNVVVEPAQIYDENGDNVTENYDITYEKGTLTVNKRKIIVTTEDGRFTYNGETQYQDDCYADRLVEGHSLSVISHTGIKNVSESGTPNDLVVKIVDENKNDTVDGYYLTDNYDITYNPGTLYMNALEITLETDGETFEYDGTWHDKKSVGVFGLMTGHTVSPIKYTEVRDVTGEEGVDNVLEYVIKNGDEDVTGNYIVTSKWGKLIVTPRKITLKTADGTFVYNGTPQSNTDIKITDGSLAPDQNIVVTKWATVTNVFDGEVENELEIEIHDSEENNVFGNYDITWEKNGTLRVNPKTITVTTGSNDFVYNGKPQYWEYATADGLEDDDTIEVVSHVTEITDVSESGALNELVIKIVNADGNNVTANYSIPEENYVYGILSMSPRPITITADSDSKFYDGTPLTNSGCKYEKFAGDRGLVSGHKVIARAEGSQTAVGESANVVVRPAEIRDENGKPVTENYAIDYVDGTLTVTALEIWVITPSVSVMYDGNDHYAIDDIKVDESKGGKLVDGHKIIAADENYPRITDAGNKTNEFAVKVVDANDDGGVNGNYVIKGYTYGTLEVTPRPITVIITGATLVYDGTEQGSDAFTVEDEPYGLVSGHIATAKADTVPTKKNVGVIEGYEFKVEITAGGQSVTGNYKITYTPGTLEITKRKVKITTPTEEFLYDGTEHAAITPEKFEIDATDGYFSLVGGHTVKPSGKYPTRIEAGSEKNVFAIMICDEYGNDVSGNYEYEADLSYGMLIVHKRAITVKTPTARLVYNGQYQHATDGCETSASSLNELVEGHVIKVDGKFPSLIDVGTTQNEFAVRIFDGVNDVTDNYVIDYEYGTLEIIPRPITIRTGDANKVYDGAPLTCNSYVDVAEDGDRGLVGGHKVTYVAVNGTRTEAGVSDNTVNLEKQPVIVDGNGKEVTKNYEVSYAYGKLTVTKRPIKITTVPATKVYDGTPLDPTLYDSYTVTSTANPALSPILAPYQSAEVDFLNTITDVGSVKNEVAVRIYADADTEKVTDLSANYEISYEYGTLSITPIQVRYTSETATKDFDGTPLTAPFDYDTTAFLTGHTPTVTFTSITFKGTINNELKSLEVVDAEGNVVPSNNYEFVPITGKVGTLTIVPIRITVQTGDAEKYYDGDPLSAEEYQVTSGNVLSGHEVLQPEFPSFTDVGRYANKIKLEIVDKTSKDDMTDGYEITYEYGEIVIKARIIKIVSGSKTKVYDSKPLTCDAYYITGLEGIDEIPDEIELAVKNIGSQTEIGSSNNYVGESKVVFAGTDEVAPGYSIVVEDLGILTVKEKSDKDKTTGGWLDDSGDVSIRGDRGDGDGGADIIAFVVNGDTSGQLYLRYKSFGSYHGTGWNAATEYGGTLDGGLSYNYLTGQTLEKYGTNQSNVTITAYAGYMLPYYFVSGNGFTKQTSDVSFVGDYSADYSVPYYIFDFSQSHALINGNYAADDDAYYEFVRTNYLDVPETTKEYLQGIALTENWVEGEITYEDIVAIAQYIRKSAKYNMEYNTRLDYEKDVVVSFLDKYKEGVCRHYASAATLLYRTLGIPARYTIGYAGSTVAGEDVEITGKQAHAWVEIYIKGLGWVDMEVTAGGAGGGGGNGDDGSDDGPIDFGDGSMDFEVKPIDVKKVYDKTPLYAESEVEINEKLRSLSDNGYYWDVTVAGSRTEYGIGESTVTEFVLYSRKGETLYEYRDGTVIENSKGFTVTFKPGKIRVMHKPIPIYLYEKDKPYDGTPLGYEPDDYYYRTSELPEGCSKIILELKGEITDVGVFDTDLLLDLDFKALDANDNDITATIKENYELDFIGTGLTVTKREITVSSGTKQKKYDGKALVCEDAWVSFGSLADGDKIVVAKATSVIDVGEEENVLVVAIMRNGVDVTSNYKINYVYGTLTIYD